MGRKLTATDLPKIILRVIVGAVFVYHGMLKVVNGMEGFVMYVGALGIPFPRIGSYLVMVTEILGGVALILGIFARWATLPLIAVMIVAIIKVTGKNGFNVFDKGYEYNLVLIACLIVIFFQGSGRFSIKR